METKKLTFYNGNHDAFIKAYKFHIQILTKKWANIQSQVKKMKKDSTSKDIVTKFLQENASTEPPKPYVVKINFSQPNQIKDPILSLENIEFGYDLTNILFQEINLNLCANDKITIVGKNGVGKSSLLKILGGYLNPTVGTIEKNSRVRIGMYDQHVADVLPVDKTPVSYINNISTDIDSRKILGSIGLPGNTHTNTINTLSGGQKARVVLAGLVALNPHVLLLDEPTNHLDVESILSLIQAINNFAGIVIMITHNIDVIQKTNSTVYELKNKTLSKIDFEEYYENILEEIDEV